MALTFKVYSDSNLTTEISTLQFSAAAINPSPEDKTVYIGSTNASNKLEANSNPGIDQIVLSINDSDPGSGHETTEFKLALTQNDLNTATPGASLNLGTQLTGGTVNAIPVYIRFENAVVNPGTLPVEISFTTNEVYESSV